ncbi:uncharacterized protein LOC110771032 [Prunus avium]|uniref:Uncharacterized protein LOC110771032 n=1 Tax=Prunus avium TaxID=42229 RepID=A0A6P5TW04_PRUAV|nr:uncharacterized protein LOC110771032 [Prunus avium]
MDGFGNDVVAEDLAVRDADRYSDDLLVISAGQHLRSLRHGICKPFSEGCSSSSKPCISDRNPGTCERRASEPTEDTRSEIVETNFNYADVLFIFKGLRLPLHGLQFAWGLAFSCWRSSVVYVRCAHLRQSIMPTKLNMPTKLMHDTFMAFILHMLFHYTWIELGPKSL